MDRYIRRFGIALSITALFAFSSCATVTQQPIAQSGYETFSVAEHPHHSIRIKKQNDELCEAGSKQYTGWLDTGGKHLFFWYVESLNDPENDPLNLWMTGGPGGSGIIGMMLELGPCFVNQSGTSTYRNPYSWTRNASMIFIDQPAGTGFSYVDEGVDIPGDSFVAAADMNVFLRIFYSAFPHFKDLAFHISGESYGGHYVPALAAEILQYNSGRPAPDFEIPLKSVMIGNGYVSPVDTHWGFYQTLCTTKPGVPKPVFNETNCKQIAETLPRCMYLYGACYDYPDPIICHAAETYCQDNIAMLYYKDVKAGGRNPFDITAPCDVDDICYRDSTSIEKYMNSRPVWSALEVPKAVANFSVISMPVANMFSKGVDEFIATTKQVKFVLESGVDVLIYNGNLDLSCNTAGNIRWTENLPWVGQVEFMTQDWRKWEAEVDGETVTAGQLKTVSKEVQGGKKVRFALVTVDRSGHMVPLDQPEVALQMIQYWMARDEGEEFFRQQSHEVVEDYPWLDL